ncbi:hypothetical protein UlMin_015247 [Ulmus minor]
MTSDGNANTYEEARKQRLEENKRRFQDLGISNISKTLNEITNSEKKKSQQSTPKQHKLKTTEFVEPRRSSRVRTPVQTYSDEFDLELPSSRRRLRQSSSSFGSYLARPIEEVRLVSYEERMRALQAAEELQSNLQSEFPCFVKSMVRSHVYSCFWLGLPSQFCVDHLPKSAVDMVLENEDGKEYDAVYIGNRSGISGGWRAFALEHKLDDGDALVFELIEPTRFKIYIVRVSSLSSQNSAAEKDKSDAKKKPKAEKLDSQSNQSQGKKKKKTTRSATKDEEQALEVSEVKVEVSPEKANGSDEGNVTRRSKRKATPRSTRI